LPVAQPIGLPEVIPDGLNTEYASAAKFSAAPPDAGVPSRTHALTDTGVFG